MLVKQTSGMYLSSILRISGVVHGYSTRSFGDIRKPSNREAFLRRFNLAPVRLVSPEQVHSNQVHVVDYHEARKQIPKVDALVFQANLPGKHDSCPVLAVRTADCVPLLLVDAVARIVAVAHAGWRGTLQSIATKVVEKMQQLGANPAQIRVSLGPHIGACCYNVTLGRARRFEQRFARDKVVGRRAGIYYLDLGAANVGQLLAAGIRAGHIDANPICTSCYHEDFFSLRRDGQAGFGETMGVIGFAN